MQDSKQAYSRRRIQLSSTKTKRITSSLTSISLGTSRFNSQIKSKERWLRISNRKENINKVLKCLIKVLTSTAKAVEVLWTSLKRTQHSSFRKALINKELQERLLMRICSLQNNEMVYVTLQYFTCHSLFSYLNISTSALNQRHSMKGNKRRWFAYSCIAEIVRRFFYFLIHS